MTFSSGGQVFFKEVDGLQIGADGVAGIDWRCWILHHWDSSSLAQLTVLGFGGGQILLTSRNLLHRALIGAEIWLGCTVKLALGILVKYQVLSSFNDAEKGRRSEGGGRLQLLTLRKTINLTQPGHKIVSALP